MGKKPTAKKEEPRRAEVPDAYQEEVEVTLSEEEAKEFVQYDLLHKLTPFLDRHFITLILTESRQVGLYNRKDVARVLLDILYESFLPFDGVMHVVKQNYEELGDEVDAKWERRKNVVSRELPEVEEKVMPLLQMLEDSAQVTKLSECKTKLDVCEKFELEHDVIDEMASYAQKSYQGANYSLACALLNKYMDLPQNDNLYFIIKYMGNGEVVGSSQNNKDDAQEAFDRAAQGIDFGKKDRDDKDSRSVILTDGVGSRDSVQDFAELSFHGKNRDKIPMMKAWWEKEMAARKAADITKERQMIWGSLAAHILNPASTPADISKFILKMDEHLNASEAPRREILVQRTWLLHWTLFAIFRMKSPDMKVLDFFLSEKSLSVISLACPHLFRYVGACLILHKRLKQIVKETVWIVHHEASSYSDPVTRFLLALYTEMDYDEAQLELQRCEILCKGDHFLRHHWQEFEENARLHIFESYCRIHQRINIGMIAEKLNMQAEEAELWIVKLIQNAKLDARIDSEKNRVVMTKAPPNVYQQVIEKTKNLAFRSTMLVSNMEKTN